MIKLADSNDLDLAVNAERAERGIMNMMNTLSPDGFDPNENAKKIEALFSSKPVPKNTVNRLK